MGFAGYAQKWLGSVFKAGVRGPESLAAIRFHSPGDVVYPGDKAPVEDHVRFLLQAKHYIRHHPVPEDRQGMLNQYSHARRPLICDDKSVPAITDCSYEHYGRNLISVGFPLFVKQAPIVKDNQLNPAFNNITLWDSVTKLLQHHLGDLGQGDAKYGYYRPTHHSYIEQPVSEEIFKKAAPILDFLTRTDNRRPIHFPAGTSHPSLPGACKPHNVRPERPLPLNFDIMDTAIV